MPDTTLEDSVVSSFSMNDGLTVKPALRHVSTFILRKSAPQSTILHIVHLCRLYLDE